MVEPRHAKIIRRRSSEGKVEDNYSKYQAQNLVLGQHEYVDDIRIEGMVYGALRFSDYPQAKVLRIDTTAAAKLDGFCVFLPRQTFRVTAPLV